jgi:hypothetical protein
MSQPVFVFGSNLGGRHGAGSAREANRNHGAKWGVGVGRTGNAYAIPTKDRNLRVLPLKQIRPYVETFIRYARANPQERFQVVAIGTGLSGYSHGDIAPMFRGCPENCELPKEWTAILENAE